LVGIKPVLFVMAEDTRDADGDGLAGVGITFWYLIRFGEFVSLRDGAKGLMHRIPSEHKARLIELGYIEEIHGGIRLTAAGKVRIAEG
jgi:predicted RNA-binding protein with RPS1 domain